MSERRTWRSGALAVLVLACTSSVWGQVPPARLLVPETVIDGPEEQSLHWPIALATGFDGEIAVADVYDPRLVVFRRVGAGFSMSRSVELPTAPVGVAFDGRRYVVALRGGGALVGVGREGTDVAPISLPPGIAVGRIASLADRSLVVWDAAGRRLLHLVDGAVAAEAPCEETVTALGAAGSDGFWAGLGRTGEVRRYDAAAKLVTSWSVPRDGAEPAWPSGLVEDPSGRLFVADRNAGRIVVLDRDGRWVGLGSGRGWDPGRLLRPIGLARLLDDSVVVGDQGNGRVQLFRVTEGPR